MKFIVVEDQPLRRSRRLQNLPPSVTVEPPPPPQKRRLDIDGSFEPVGVSEVPGEPELRINQEETTAVETKDLQVDKFARNLNPPLTDLNDPMIVQVHPFNPPVIGVPLGRIMSIAGESSLLPLQLLQLKGCHLPR